jgi:WD40 repeat protein
MYPVWRLAQLKEAACLQVRKWDITTGAATDTYNGSHAVYCMAAARDQPLVAFGGAEKALRLWDPRTPVGKEVVRRAAPPLADQSKAMRRR